MDERQIRELIREYSPSTEPPKRRRNILRALSILFAVAILAVGVTTLIFLYFEQTTTSPQEQTIIIKKGDKFVPYPHTPAQAADRFGGEAKDWSENMWIKAWVYNSDTPIEIPIARNVTVDSDHFTLLWQQVQGKEERSKGK